MTANRNVANWTRAISDGRGAQDRRGNRSRDLILRAGNGSLAIVGAPRTHTCGRGTEHGEAKFPSAPGLGLASQALVSSGFRFSVSGLAK